MDNLLHLGGVFAFGRPAGRGQGSRRNGDVPLARFPLCAPRWIRDRWAGDSSATMFSDTGHSGPDRSEGGQSTVNAATRSPVSFPQKEILDDPGVPDHLRELCCRDLARTHRWLGNTRLIFNRILRDPLPVSTVLDIGCAPPRARTV